MDRHTERSEPEEHQNPMELVGAFARSQNYPREPENLLFLAQALKKTAVRFGVSMDDIVSKCAETSAYCPTDADLMNVGRELRDERLRITEKSPAQKLREQFGSPQPFDMSDCAIDMERVKRRRSESDALWNAVRSHLNLRFTRGEDWPHTDRTLEILRSLGFPKTEYQKTIMKAWGNSGTR